MPITSNVNSKKRKAGDDNGNTKKGKSNKSSDNNSSATDDFSTLKLDEIRDKIKNLCDRVPVIPPSQFYLPKEDVGGGAPGGEDATIASKATTTLTVNPLDAAVDKGLTREWAAQLQAVLEEYNLLVCCVSTAEYRWGTEKTGAADQNLGLLNNELASSQDSISSTVTPRLTNVLAPVVDLVIDRTVTTYRYSSAENGDVDEGQKKEEKISQYREEIKQNHFTRKLVDPDFLQLCYKILARNAPLLRRVVLSNFHKVVKAMDDYLKAQKNDTSQSRNFAY